MSALTAKSTSAPAVLKLTRPFVSVMSSPLITILPPLTDVAPITLPPLTLPVALINPPVNILPPVMFPVALAVPPVAKLPPVMVPVALIKPVTYSPVVANTATLPVPPIPTVTFPPELTTVTLLVPLLIFATLVITPVSETPLPKI